MAFSGSFIAIRGGVPGVCRAERLGRCLTRSTPLHGSRILVNNAARRTYRDARYRLLMRAVDSRAASPRFDDNARAKPKARSLGRFRYPDTPVRCIEIRLRIC